MKNYEMQKKMNYAPILPKVRMMLILSRYLHIFPG